MPLPLRALLDPESYELDFPLGQGLVPECGGRHPLGLVIGRNAQEEFARLRIADHDRLASVGQRCRRPRLGIEPQARHPLGLVGPVARVAVLGQYRSDVAIEENLVIGPPDGCRDEHRCQKPTETTPSHHSDNCKTFGHPDAATQGSISAGPSDVAVRVTGYMTCALPARLMDTTAWASAS